MLKKALLVLALTLAGCNTRPGPEVLAPDASALPEGARLVRVLAVTTRAPEAQFEESYQRRRRDILDFLGHRPAA